MWLLECEKEYFRLCHMHRSRHTHTHDHICTSTTSAQCVHKFGARRALRVTLTLTLLIVNLPNEWRTCECVYEWGMKEQVKNAHAFLIRRNGCLHNFRLCVVVVVVGIIALMRLHTCAQFLKREKAESAIYKLAFFCCCHN